MDTNNLDKWWYGLPENTRQAIGNDPGFWVLVSLFFFG